MWVMRGHARKLYINGDLYSMSYIVMRCIQLILSHNKLYSCAIKLHAGTLILINTNAKDNS